MQKLQQIFPYPLIAIVLGVGLGSLIGNPWQLALWSLAGAFLLVFFHLFSRRQGYALAMLLLAMFSLGALRYALWLDEFHQAPYAEVLGTRITMVALLVDEPDERETSTHLFVQPLSINGQDFASDARVLVFAPKYPKFQYGDVLQIGGVLKKPEPFGDEGMREFDYPMFLASKNVHALIFFPNVTFQSGGEGNVVVAKLFQFKNYFLRKISLIFPEPQSSLLSGLILGGKQSLGSEWLDIFKLSGIIHIVVLSGYNMTIVSQWLVAIFRFLGFYGSLSMGTFGIILFTIMTGAGATVVRAAVMAIIALLARATGRTYTMGRALLLAGVFMVIHNPSILLFDPSFQLSFLASLGLIFVSPVLETRLSILRRHKTLREVVVSTLATQIMVLPLLLYQTGMLSLVALPVNFLVLPVIPLTMLFGFVAGVVAIAIPPLAGVVALPAQLLLTYILGIARFGASIPYATVSVPIGWIALLALYALLAVTLWRAHRTMELTRLSPTVAIPLSPTQSGGSGKKEIPPLPQ